jgi:hypothetical protein
LVSIYPPWNAFIILKVEISTYQRRIRDRNLVSGSNAFQYECHSF